jgi:hypothetical protein
LVAVTRSIRRALTAPKRIVSFIKALEKMCSGKNDDAACAEPITLKQAAQGGLF